MSENPFNIETDLKTLIDGGLADNDLIAKALVNEYYLEMYQLALAILDDPISAQRATTQSISRAYMDQHKGGRHSIDRLWSFGQSIKVINRLAKAKPKSGIPKKSIEISDPLLVLDSAKGIHKAFESYGRKEQYVIALYYLLGWQIDDIAALLKVNANAVESQLDLSRDRFKSVFDKSDAGSINEAGQVEEPIHLDERISNIFKKLWPKPSLDQDEWDDIAEKILSFDAKEVELFGLPGKWGWAIVISAGLLMITIVTLVSGLLLINGRLPGFEELSSEEVTPAPTKVLEIPPEAEALTYLYVVQPGDSLERISLKLKLPREQIREENDITPDSPLTPGQPLKVVPYAVNFPTQSEPFESIEVEALGSKVDSETIKQRLNSSHTLWSTLWIDTQSIDYGPVGYIGDPRIYHSQAWIDQPVYSLELFGLFGKEPSSVSLVADGSHYMLNPEQQIPKITSWDDLNRFPLQRERLRWMVYPLSAPWGHLDGHFEVIENSEIAERGTITVDWYDNSGNRRVRLWLDRSTGMALRLQEYGGPDFETLLSDTMTTAIIYNIEIPHGSLFDPHALLIQDYATLPGDDDLTDRPEEAVLEIPANERPRLPIHPAPPDYDPAASQLHFQFPEGNVSSDPQSGPTINKVMVFADGYSLGEAMIYAPWGLQCARSPDGQHLVYNSQSEGISTSDLSLRWIKLTNPEFIYEPLKGFQAETFAFAPDSRRLAVYGTDLNGGKRSIQIVDLGNGDSWQLFEIYDADSLVWSPDGNYLALIGQRSDTPEHNIMVLNVALGEIIFENKVQLTDGSQEFIWPDLNWALEFPIPMGDLGVCAAPPIE